MFWIDVITANLRRGNSGYMEPDCPGGQTEAGKRHAPSLSRKVLHQPTRRIGTCRAAE